MEVADNGNGPSTATVEAPGTDAGATAPPSSSESNAADTAGKTAPPASLAREAFDRLAKGEQPRDVNRELYTKPSSTPAAAEKPAAKPAASSTTTTTTTTKAPAAKDGQHAQASATPQPGNATTTAWPEGVTAKDQQVLKRAQMDPETWSAIPPSNQKKILANLAASQSAADRAFAQNRQQQQAPGQARTQTPGAGTQTDPDPQDAATQSGEPATEQQQQPPAQQRQQQQQSAQPAAADAQLIGRYLDSKDLETLKAIGGDDLADVYTRGISRVVTQLNQEQSQLLNVAEFLLNEHVNGQFDRAVQNLAETPGLATLKDGTPQSQQQLDALKDKAMFLHRAAGDPKGYSFAEAVKDAAASLFKSNITQAAQAQLLASRKTSLRGSPDKGVGQRNQAKSLSGKERDHAIFQQLREGKSPNDARNAVDGM